MEQEKAGKTKDQPDTKKTGKGRRGKKPDKTQQTAGNHRTVTKVATEDMFSPASPDKTDKKDTEAFEQPGQSALPPRHYFDNVAKRSQQLEQERRKKTQA